MRNVAIYTADNTLIGNQFKQLNDVKLHSAPVMKSYTMADGSPCIYTAVNAKSTTEIVLECSQADARRLSSYASSAEFSFTGLNIISNSNFSDTVHCYLMGAVQVELVSEKADICQVRIPVQVVNLS
jgi:hypothetical protein